MCFKHFKLLHFYHDLTKSLNYENKKIETNIIDKNYTKTLPPCIAAIIAVLIKT